MSPKSSSQSPNSPSVTPDKQGQRSLQGSPKRSCSPLNQPQSSPKSDSSWLQPPPTLTRPTTLEIERPVELKRRQPARQSLVKEIQTEGDIDSPAPPSTNTSSKHSVVKDPLVIMPVTLSNPPSPISTPQIERKSEAKPPRKRHIPEKQASSPSKRIEKDDCRPESAKHESFPQISMVEPSRPTPALSRSILHQFNH